MTPEWQAAMAALIFGDDRPKAYGLLTEPPAAGRETRQQRRRDARVADKRKGPTR